MTYIFEEADKLRNQGKSLQAAKEYLKISSDPAQSEEVKLSALHMAAVSYSQAGEIASAEKIFEELNVKLKSSKDEILAGRILRDIGIAKLNSQDFEDSKKYLELSLEKLQSSSEIGELAMTQSKLAVVFTKLNNSKESKSLAKEATKNANKSENTFYIATAYQELARVHFLNQNFEEMLDPLYAALGALKLESDPHAKRHAELFLSLNFAYEKLSNNSLAEKSLSLAEYFLNQLDEPTAERIRGFFKD